MRRPRASWNWLVPIGLALLLGGFVVTRPMPVSAAPLHVTDCGDAGANTLRGMIGSAAAGDTIVFDQDCTGATAITLATGTLTLTKDVTIDGTGHTVVVDGNCTLTGGVCTSGGVTVFTVNSGVTANLSNLTIQHGNAPVQCDVSACGGGIFNNGGTLTVANSTLSGNNARDIGGGISNVGTATVTSSTLSGNSAFIGGGIYNAPAGTLTVTSSTFSGNHATDTFPNGVGGGGIFVEGGAATVTNSTISHNTALYGGGIDNLGTLALTNTIVSGNSGDDLIGTGSTSNSHNLIGGNPFFAPLGNYGGPTQTFALLPGSPALEAGDDATCTATGIGKVNSLDQRGILRPQGAHCDIGAFESQGFTVAITGGDPQSAVLSQPFATPLAVSVTSSHSEPVDGGVITFIVNPVGGANATLTGSPATIASGVASVTAQANGTAGSYTVTAASGASGVGGSATFHLTNAAVALVVNNTGDGTVNMVNCVVGNASTCRLRDAIALVNTGAAGGQTAITSALPNPSTITLDGAQGPLNIAAGMTITGPGAAALTISGNNATSVLFVGVGGGATAISGVTIAGGNSTNANFGGGITNIGNSMLTVTNSTLSGNNSPSGGGINNNPGCTLTVTNTTLSGNRASGGSGGGIYNASGGTLTVTNSTFSANSAANGGGIYNSSLQIVTVTNSLFSGNSVSGNASTGGGIYNNGFLALTNSTFSGNSTSGSANAGGGIYNAVNNSGYLVVTNSTLASNSATTGGGIANSGRLALTNTIVSGNSGVDLIGVAPTVNSHNLIGGTPLLGPLASNGGPTQTLALLPGSPALEAGDDVTCTNTDGIAPVAGKDQRGIVRPQGAHCDIGAYEYTPPNPLPGAKPPGGGSGSPNPLPGSRPAGSPGGNPNPLPLKRP